MYLNLVTEVDNNGVAQWGHINPLAIFKKLKATDFVILEEQDDAAGVGVSPETLDQIWLGAWWVVANFGTKGWSVCPMKDLFQVPLLYSKILA